MFADYMSAINNRFKYIPTTPAPPGHVLNRHLRRSTFFAPTAIADKPGYNPRHHGLIDLQPDADYVLDQTVCGSGVSNGFRGFRIGAIADSALAFCRGNGDKASREQATERKDHGADGRTDSYNTFSIDLRSRTALHENFSNTLGQSHGMGHRTSQEASAAVQTSTRALMSGTKKRKISDHNMDEEFVMVSSSTPSVPFRPSHTENMSNTSNVSNKRYKLAEDLQGRYMDPNTQHLTVANGPRYPTRQSKRRTAIRTASSAISSLWKTTQPRSDLGPNVFANIPLNFEDKETEVVNNNDAKVRYF